MFTDAKVDIKTCNQHIVLFVERETVLMKIRYEPNISLPSLTLWNALVFASS